MNSEINPSDKIILALDGMNKSEAFSLISKIPDLKWVKVGLELFVDIGPGILSDLRDLGLSIFLDLKFHDIPVTMACACKQAAKNGVQLISVHVSAGNKALISAVESSQLGAKEAGFPSPTLLGVTVLTSWDQKRLNKELSIDQTIQERVEHMAKIAFQSGLGGCICSPKEVARLRMIYPKSFELVTPGIRLPSDNLNDQVRVLSPSNALSAGASRLVIGRPITKSVDPFNSFHEFCEDVRKSYLV